MTIKYDHSNEYYRTDLKEEAIDYLDKLSLFLDKTVICKSFWKWVIISLHGSLYHFILLALRNTDGSGVYKKEIRNKKGHIDFSKENEMRLINFLEAFKRIKDTKRMGGYGNSKFYVSNKNIDIAMKNLNEWRNSFIHYKPKGWSIEIEIFKIILKEVLPVLKFIVNDSGRILLEENEISPINKIVEKIEIKSKSGFRGIETTNRSKSL